MLKLIVMVVISATLVSAGFLAVKRHNEYQTQKQHDTAVAQKAASEAQAKEQASATAERTKLVDKYNKLLVECQKGKANFDQLPKNLQKPVQNPSCGTAVLQ